MSKTPIIISIAIISSFIIMFSTFLAPASAFGVTLANKGGQNTYTTDNPIVSIIVDTTGFTDVQSVIADFSDISDTACGKAALVSFQKLSANKWVATCDVSGFIVQRTPVTKSIKIIVANSTPANINTTEILVQLQNTTVLKKSIPTPPPKNISNSTSQAIVPPAGAALQNRSVSLENESNSSMSADDAGSMHGNGLIVWIVVILVILVVVFAPLFKRKNPSSLTHRSFNYYLHKHEKRK